MDNGLLRQDDDAIGPQRLPKPLARALSTYVILLLACGIAEVFSRLRHWGYPYVWPLAPPYPPFVDFTYVLPRFACYGTSRFFAVPGLPFTYPAPLAPVFAAFVASPKPLVTFLGTVLLAFTTAGLLFARALKKTNVHRTTVITLLAAYVFSFPLWFAVGQGNCESIVWMVLALGLWAFRRDRPLLAATLFGVAGSLKLYPFVFLGLFVAQRRYRALAAGCLTAFLVTLVSLKLETGSILVSWHGTAQGLEQFRQIWALAPESSGFDHSIFGTIKRVGGLGRGTPRSEVAWALQWYTVLVATVALVLFVTRIRRLPPLNQIVSLTVIAILFPPTSFDYTLIHLYVPCALLVLLALREHQGGTATTRPGLSCVLLLFAILLAPLTEFIYRGVSFAGELECLALLLLLLVSLRYPWAEEQSPALATAA